MWKVKSVVIGGLYLLGFLLNAGAVCAQDKKVVVIPLMDDGGAPVEKTGLSRSDVNYDDGYYQKGVSWPSPRFTSGGKYNLTGLTWQTRPSSGLRTWVNAISHCESLGGDWRLPNIKEMLSLIDYGNINSALPTGHPFGTPYNGWYWTSTAYAVGSPSSIAWQVLMVNGEAQTEGKITSACAWCVSGP
jgi:hypothetical protein